MKTETDLTLLNEEQLNRSRQINLTLLFSGVFIVFINFSSAFTTLPLYVLKLGGNEFQSGLQNTIFFLSAILLRTYFGPLADTKGRKIPLIIGVFVFATAPLLFWLSSNVWLLILARIYHAIGLAAFFSSSSSLVADLAPPNKTGLFISSYRILMSLSLLVGPAGTLIIIDRYGYSTWFLMSFLLGLLGILPIAFLKTPLLSVREKISSWARLKTVFLDRRLWTIFRGINLAGVCIGAVLTFVVIYISRFTPVENPGIYLSCYAFGGISANLINGRLSDRFGRRTVFWPAVILMGLGIMSISFIPQWPQFLILSGMLTGIGTASTVSTGFAWIIDLVEEDLRATSLAFIESNIDICIALGSFIFGITSGWIGLSASFAALGVLPLAVGLVSLITKSSLWNGF